MVPATGSEAVDGSIGDDIVARRSNKSIENSRIEAIRHAEGPEALLTKVQSIVGNDDYAVEDDGELRAPELGDIAVLTRTKDFGRELLRTAREHDIPMAYEGGIELFRTDQMKLLLAWLRILESDHERGWAVVLERAGYTLDEIDHLLETEDYPEAMQVFKAELGALQSVGGVAEAVMARYGYDGTYADVVIETVQDAHDATTMTRGDLIRFIERGIDEGATREVSAPAGSNAVTVQTIHAAKGLEYPIVVLANMNRHQFPPSGGGWSVISFDEPVGLRQRDVFADDHGYPYVYDNWRADVVHACLPNEYDEERRLLYVAMTRAEHHLVFTAGEEPNTFLEELPVAVEELEPDVEEHRDGETVQSKLDISIPVPEGPAGWNPHDLMRDDVFAETEEGKGTVFGTQVHEFAEAYARGEDPQPGGDEPDWDNVRAFIDGLENEPVMEQPAVLPLEVDGETVALNGLVDLVCVGPERVLVVDYKTDRSRRAADEYRKQVSVYYHVVAAAFPDREVDVQLFYTHQGEAVPIEPLSTQALSRLVNVGRPPS
jgi:ATP-dependent exoDNAse (exonuclease V) beta subunit